MAGSSGDDELRDKGGAGRVIARMNEDGDESVARFKKKKEASANEEDGGCRNHFDGRGASENRARYQAARKTERGMTKGINGSREMRYVLKKDSKKTRWVGR